MSKESSDSQTPKQIRDRIKRPARGRPHILDILRSALRPRLRNAGQDGQTTRQVQVVLTERLVGELPRFFGGLRAALRELFQNAYRAGAAHVHVEVETGVVTFTDDGHGCPDPQMLLSAGGTGWNENEVTEPAGLGFFSILDPDLVRSVEASSGNWRLTLEPNAVLRQEHVEVCTTEECLNGFRVRVLLQEDLPVERILADVRAARGVYPFHVSCNDQVIDVDDWDSILDLQTSVGRVQVREHRQRRRPSEGVWEYRSVEGEAFKQALEEAARTNPAWRRLPFDFRFRWFIEPDCGVRPKLPDRNALNPDTSLRNAANAILHQVHYALVEQAREASSQWPDEFPTVPGGPPWLTRTAYAIAVLRELGWRLIRWTDYARSIGYLDNEDCLIFERGGDRRFARSFILVETEDVAQSINIARSLGARLPLAFANEKGVALEIVGRHDPERPESHRLVSLAERITVGGVELPFVLEDWDDDYGATVVLACDGDEATAVVTGTSSLAGMNPGYLQDSLVMYLTLAHEDHLFDLGWDHTDSDRNFDADPVARTLLEEVSREFVGGERAEARLRLHVLQDEMELVCQAAADLQHHVSERPEHPAALQAVKSLQEAIRADLEQAREAAALPVHPALAAMQ